MRFLLPTSYKWWFWHFLFKCFKNTTVRLTNVEISLDATHIECLNQCRFLQLLPLILKFTNLRLSPSIELKSWYLLIFRRQYHPLHISVICLCFTVTCMFLMLLSFVSPTTTLKPSLIFPISPVCDFTEYIVIFLSQKSLLRGKLWK